MIRIYHNGIGIEVDTVTEATQLLKALNTHPTTTPVEPTDKSTPVLTPTEHDTLQYLHEHGDTTAAELAADRGLTLGAAGRRLRQLLFIGAAERPSRGIYRPNPRTMP